MAVPGASFLLDSLIPIAFHLVVHLEYDLGDLAPLVWPILCSWRKSK
jgi:hypothetical protein